MHSSDNVKKILFVSSFLLAVPVFVTASTSVAKTPVLIVPGVLGTEMVKGNDLLWANPKMSVLTDNFMDPLGFSSTLVPSDGEVNFKTVIKSINKKVLGADIVLLDYTKSLIEEFKGQGYTEGVDLFTFPYDWRYGVTGKDVDGKEVNVEALKGQIDYIVNQTEAGIAAGKVDVVAHSTGGLVVKQYVWEHKTDHHIGKAVMVGVPNQGAPKAFKVLISGDNFDIPGLNPEEMKKLAQNMPVVYDLTPQKGFGYGFLKIHNNLVDDPDLKDRELSYDEAIAEFVKLKLINEAALKPVQEMHERLETVAYPSFDFYKFVDAYVLASCGVATFGQFTETINKFSEPEFDFPKLVTGDGTVPHSSAGAITVRPGGHVFWVLKVKHGQLLSGDGPRQQIVNIITGSKLDVSGKVLDEVGFIKDQTICDLKKGHWWQIFSPVNIEVVDEFGNRSGLLENGSIQNDIPGADFEIFGDHKYMYVPTESNQKYTVNLSGTADGTFTFKSLEMKNGEMVSEQTFADLPVTTNLKGTVTEENDQTVLNLDVNGDGILDQIVDQEGVHEIMPSEKEKIPPTPTPEPTPPVSSGGNGGGYIYFAPKVLAATKIADGTLVLDVSDGRTVYMIGTGGKKYGFTSEKIFRGFGFNFSNLITADISGLVSGGVIDANNMPHPDGSLISDGRRISFINFGKRYTIPNMYSFTEQGFNMGKIVSINKYDKALEARNIAEMVN
jgi:hypothetical protein